MNALRLWRLLRAWRNDWRCYATPWTGRVAGPCQRTAHHFGWCKDADGTEYKVSFETCVFRGGMK